MIYDKILSFQFLYSIVVSTQKSETSARGVYLVLMYILFFITVDNQLHKYFRDFDGRVSAI